MLMTETTTTRTSRQFGLAPTNVLSPEQVEFYKEHGWLRIEQMFDPAEIDRMSDDLDWLIENWAIKDQG